MYVRKLDSNVVTLITNLLLNPIKLGRSARCAGRTEFLTGPSLPATVTTAMQYSLYRCGNNTNVGI